MAKKQIIPQKYQVWVEVRRRYHLSDAQVQMARELGLNPHKFGKLANEKQEPWKKPLPEFIEEIYFKRFREKATGRSSQYRATGSGSAREEGRTESA